MNKKEILTPPMILNQEMIINVLSKHVLNADYYCKCGFDYDGIFFNEYALEYEVDEFGYEHEILKSDYDEIFNEAIYKHQAEEIVKILGD